jgi:hypothetical protein
MESFDNQIEKYLSGELTSEQLHDFETALKADPALAQKVADHRAVIHQLDALRLREKVRNTLRTTPAPTPFFQKYFWQILALACLFLFAGIWVSSTSKTPHRNHTPEQPTTIDSVSSGQPIAPSVPIAPPAVADQKQMAQKRVRETALAKSFYQKPLSSGIRNTETTSTVVNNAISEAYAAYEKGDAAGASKWLRSDALVTKNEAVRYLRANSLFQSGQFAAAATDFDALSNSFQYKHEARWHFLLCQLALGKTTWVRQQLGTMVDDSTFPLSQEARKLQQKLME